MDRTTFALRLREAAVAAREFAGGLVEEALPEPMSFRVRLNCSYDGNPLRSDETLYPEDSSLEQGKRALRLTEEGVVGLLWREGRIPEWIDISVVNEIDATTILELRCCGRFTSDEELLYHAWQGRPPFQVVGPTLPPRYQEGETFSIHHRSVAWSAADLEELKPHRDKIWSLELVGQEFDDHGLNDLPECPAMHLLQLRQTSVSARGLGFVNRHRLLRVLNIFPPSSPSLDLTTLPRLRNLSSLDIYKAGSVRCAFGWVLLKLPQLNHLMMDCARTLYLEGRLPKALALLSLRASKLEGHFSVPPNVEMLALHLEEASDSEIEKLVKKLKIVRSLDLSGTPVTDRFVRSNAKRWPLKNLNVSHTKVSGDAVEEFRAAHPGLSIVPGSVRGPGARPKPVDSWSAS